MSDDKLVAPLYEREPDNAPGAFYVMKDVCIVCGTVGLTAPKCVTWSKRMSEGDIENCPSHCRVERQPETPAELEQMIEAVWASCVQAIRYCGADPYVLKRLQEKGCAEQCDALVRR